MPRTKERVKELKAKAPDNRDVIYLKIFGDQTPTTINII